MGERLRRCVHILQSYVFTETANWVKLPIPCVEDILYVTVASYYSHVSVYHLVDRTSKREDKTRVSMGAYPKALQSS